jgi:FixJ family two-component response regulator
MHEAHVTRSDSHVSGRSGVIAPSRGVSNRGNDPLATVPRNVDLFASRAAPDAPSIFIVDSDAFVREALHRLVRSAGWEPATCASAEEFLDRPRLLTPCCLLAEVHLPGLSGLDLQERLLERKEMQVVLMSEHIDVRMAVKAMKAGAFEVLPKPISTDLLLSTIGCAIERSRAAVNRRAQMDVLQERYSSLSAREREVMSLVVSGRLNKQVSGDLGITEFTVKAHRGRLMRKMHASSLAELVMMVESLRRWTGAAASPCEAF